MWICIGNRCKAESVTWKKTEYAAKLLLYMAHYSTLVSKNGGNQRFQVWGSKSGVVRPCSMAGAAPQRRVPRANRGFSVWRRRRLTILTSQPWYWRWPELKQYSGWSKKSHMIFPCFLSIPPDKSLGLVGWVFQTEFLGRQDGLWQPSAWPVSDVTNSGGQNSALGVRCWSFRVLYSSIYYTWLCVCIYYIHIIYIYNDNNSK